MYFCCRSLCYYTFAAAAVLLLAAAVLHRVPDGKICCCGPLHLIAVIYLSSFKHDLFLMHPLAVLASIYLINVFTSSVMTGMRGAKAGVSPPRRSPRWNKYDKTIKSETPTKGPGGTAPNSRRAGTPHHNREQLRPARRVYAAAWQDLKVQSLKFQTRVIQARQ